MRRVRIGINGLNWRVVAALTAREAAGGPPMEPAGVPVPESLPPPEPLPLVVGRVDLRFCSAERRIMRNASKRVSSDVSEVIVLMRYLRNSMRL